MTRPCTTQSTPCCPPDGARGQRWWLQKREEICCPGLGLRLPLARHRFWRASGSSCGNRWTGSMCPGALGCWRAACSCGSTLPILQTFVVGMGGKKPAPPQTARKCSALPRPRHCILPPTWRVLRCYAKTLPRWQVGRLCDGRRLAVRVGELTRLWEKRVVTNTKGLVWCGFHGRVLGRCGAARGAVGRMHAGASNARSQVACRCPVHTKGTRVWYYWPVRGAKPSRTKKPV